MNKLEAIVSKVKSKDSLNLVFFSFKSLILSMISLDLSEKIKDGTKVIVSVKPTNITLAKDFEGLLSSSNKLKGKVTFIEEGELLSSVTCDILCISMQSMITTNALKQMNLSLDEEITLLFKASDLSIREIIND